MLRGAQQFRENGYHDRIFNPVRQPLPDAGTARVFRVGRVDCCPFLRAQRRARQAARFPSCRPIGGHLFRIRFLAGLICRGASPPPDDSAGIPPPCNSSLDLDTVRDRPRSSVRPRVRPYARGRARRADGRWTNGRSSCVTAGRIAYPAALRTPQSAGKARPTRRQIGHRPRAYGDPGVFWHAQRSSRHTAEPMRQATPTGVP